MAKIERVTANQDGTSSPSTIGKNKRELIEALRKMRNQIKHGDLKAHGVIVIVAHETEAAPGVAVLSYIWEGLTIPVTIEMLRRAADQIDEDYPKPQVDRIEAEPVKRCGFCHARDPGHQWWCIEIEATSEDEPQLPPDVRKAAAVDDANYHADRLARGEGDPGEESDALVAAAQRIEP